VNILDPGAAGLVLGHMTITSTTTAINATPAIDVRYFLADASGAVATLGFGAEGTTNSGA
jgi:hypothetical protein